MYTGKFVALDAYMKEKGKSQINNLSSICLFEKIKSARRIKQNKENVIHVWICGMKQKLSLRTFRHKSLAENSRGEKMPKDIL